MENNFKSILGKAVEEEISREEALTLFREANALDKILELFKVANNIRKIYMGDAVQLRAAIKMSSICMLSPKCKYCGWAAGTSTVPQIYQDGKEYFTRADEEIEKIAIALESAGIRSMTCAGGCTDTEGQEAVRCAKAIKRVSDLDVIPVYGCDMSIDSLKELKKIGISRVCCGLETTNEFLFSCLKPGDSLKKRLSICQWICDLGLELSTILMIGVGEQYEDRVNDLFLLKQFKNLTELSISSFMPRSGTPMANYPACTAFDHAKTIAIARIVYKDVHIPTTAPYILPFEKEKDNLQLDLMAGADIIGGVTPHGLPSDVSQSIRQANLNETVRMVNEIGLNIKL